MIVGFQIIEKEIREKIVDELDKIGLLYRIFSRPKNIDSINEKIKRKNKDCEYYKVGDKLMQDVIGIRIVTYFKDDIELIIEILKETFSYISEEIDNHTLTVFKPVRTNIICDFNKNQKKIFKEIQLSNPNSSYDLIDSTFELQLRTMLSEGWHEIDHSLRYKSKSDWKGHEEYERLLNGIYASLETNDIALKNLFNDLAYKHFKSCNWEGLIRTKFRIHTGLTPLRKELKQIIDSNHNIGKEIVRLNRQEILFNLYKLDLSLPVNMNNLIFLINAIGIKNKDIYEITPSIIKESIY